MPLNKGETCRVRVRARHQERLGGDLLHCRPGGDVECCADPSSIVRRSPSVDRWLLRTRTLLIGSEVRSATTPRLVGCSSTGPTWRAGESSACCTSRRTESPRARRATSSDRHAGCTSRRRHGCRRRDLGDLRVGQDPQVRPRADGTQVGVGSTRPSASALSRLPPADPVLPRAIGIVVRRYPGLSSRGDHRIDELMGCGIVAHGKT
jgi:hypothetical protein